MALGFDGLELHGAHGYFLDQFVWERTNKRTDRYGGTTLGERARFVADVVMEVRRQVGADFPISLRISQWKLGAYDVKNAATPEELENWLTPLVEAGVDIFHCSNRRFWQPEFEGSNLNLAGWVKKVTGKPTITVGSVSLNEDFISTFGRLPHAEEDGDPKAITFHDLEDRLEHDEFDLVAVGRALISNPNWANLVRENKADSIKPYNSEDLKELN
jgi:2,4-dienoyl-CoA reductase-like NADH-dependent reductase (Old Yellow Enzyme family)